MHPYDVLRRPIITEKTTSQGEHRRYTFAVHPQANQHQIKEAVERAFNVKVIAVNVIVHPGKPRRYGRRVVEPHPWKKATVTLAEGGRIEFFEGV